MLIDPKEYDETINLMALRSGVKADIHKEDFIFQFLMQNNSFGSKEDALSYYFTDGANSCGMLLSLVSTYLKSASAPRRILEFASGYGCVSRHLAKQVGYEFTPCDIHIAATDFLHDNLGLNALQSSHSPEDFVAPQLYDVAFALSFFSHMPDATWGRWVGALLKAVRPGGLLIFTTQGQSSAKIFGDPPLDENGYWFLADSEQKDLDVEEYGQTIVTPSYVFRQISAHGNAEPAFFQEGYWWGHQDVYVIRKAAAL